jgi:hypothetical protein
MNLFERIEKNIEKINEANEVKKYKLKNPESKEEANVIYVMVDDRGDRALYKPINLFKGWRIVPTEAMLKSDMEEIDKEDIPIDESMEEENELVGDNNTEYYVIRGDIGEFKNRVLTKAMSKKEAEEDIKDKRKLVALKNLKITLAPKGTEIFK